MTAETPEGRDREAMAKGVEAEQELRVLGECFEMLRDEYVKVWQATSAKDVDAREKLFLAHGMIGKVEAQMRQFVQDGMISRKTIERDAGVKRPFLQKLRA